MESSRLSANRSETDIEGTRVLFIAFFYPPATSTGVPGSLRTIKFLRNLSNGDFDVLTTLPEVGESDNALNHLHVPVAGERIHRVGKLDIFAVALKVRRTFKALFFSTSSKQANHLVFNTQQSKKPTQPSSRLQKLKDIIYNLCYFPDQASPWILPALLRGKRICRTRRIQVIFATGSPWSALLVGVLLHKVTRIPLFCDFRDPWSGNPFHRSKGRLLDRLGNWLEEKVVTNSAAISLNTEPLKDQFIERYPSHVSKFLVLPNGIDDSDLDTPQECSNEASPSEKARGQPLDLCHAGFLYGVRDPAPLLDAIRIVNRESANKSVVRFTQVGNISLSYDLKSKYSDLIENDALIIKESIPYSDCLKALKASDILVNIQPWTKTQIPSKLYDYLALRKPILHLTPSDGALAMVVEENELGEHFPPDNPDIIASYLRKKVSHLNRNGQIRAHYPNRSKFEIQEITKVLAKRILEIKGN